MAVANGHLEILKFLKENLKEKFLDLANIENSSSNTPLHWCVLNNQKDCMTFLLETGVDANKKNEDEKTALDLAIEFGKEELVEGLAKKTKVKEEEKSEWKEAVDEHEKKNKEKEENNKNEDNEEEIIKEEVNKEEVKVESN